MHLGIPGGRNRKWRDESEVLGRCIKIAQQPDFLKFGYSFGDLKRWWDWRVKAVHPEHKISNGEARRFVIEVGDFSDRLMAYWLQKVY